MPIKPSERDIVAVLAKIKKQVDLKAIFQNLGS